MMKIAMISTWFPPIIVGSGIRYYEIGKRLAKKHEIHVYCCGMKNTPKNEEIDGIYVHRFGTFDSLKSIEKESFPTNLKFSLKILKNFQELKDFDIIDCNIVSKITPYVAYAISKSSKVPLIETWHEVWYNQNLTRHNPAIGLPGLFIELLLPKLSSVNIAVSKTTKIRLVTLLKANLENIVVIPNGVDLEKFSQISVKKRYGRILYAGRLEEHKRVDVLIKSYKRLKRKFPEIELIIVGTGPKKSQLQKLASDCEDIIFYNPLPYEKLIELFKSSWIFVLPSVMEGQGIVLLESMSAGTPPIAVKARESGVKDIIKEGYNGLLVSEMELEKGGIEKSIEKLLLDENLYNELRKNCLNFVKAYDWNKIASKVIETYEKALNLI